MPYIAGYLLKLSLSLSVVYLFYILVLRRLTFYTWNRWYLLGYSLLAFFIPFVNISPVLQQGEWDKNLVVQLIPMFSNFEAGSQAALSNTGFAWWSYLLAGAVVGILLMGVRFMIRYISYYRIRRSAQLLVDDGVKVYHVDKSIIPFSFGNAIFINRRLHAEEDLQQIIHHEFIHVKQKHTVDILCGELLCMLNWYNPFAWLIRKAIRQNLEFIADHKVLENGIDKKHYQYLLLKVTGAAHFSITQQFNFSSLKKRIIMMNRSRSAKIQLTRFLFMVPLLTVLLLAFRSNVMEHSREVGDVTANTSLNLKEFLTAKLATAIDTVPGEKKDLVKELILKKNPSIKNLTWQKAAWSVSDPVYLSVFRRDGTVEKYDWSDMQARNLFKKRYGVLPEAPPNHAVEINWQVDTAKEAAVDASLRGPGNPYSNIRLNDVLIVIDDVVQTEGTDYLSKVDPANIQSMTVLKDESATARFGDAMKGKKGAIEIITKEGVPLLKDSIFLKGRPVITFRGRVNAPVALYIVDGIEFSAAEFEKMSLEPDRIESIEVLKGESATKIYGQNGKNGVIIIKLKKLVTAVEQQPLDMDALKEMFKGSDQVIWFVHGYTYAVAGGGSIASFPGIVNTVIVDDRFYTAEEVNRLFKRSDFASVGGLDAKTVSSVHGRNVPAMVLSKNGIDSQNYQQSKSVSINQPGR